MGGGDAVREALVCPQLALAGALYSFNMSLAGAMLLGYVQSRMVCDEPLAVGDFTGSALCGSKQQVVEKATQFLAVIRSLQSAGALAKLILKASIADRVNPRLLVLVHYGSLLVAAIAFSVLDTFADAQSWWKPALSVVLVVSSLTPDFGLEFIWIDLTQSKSYEAQMQVFTNLGLMSKVGGVMGNLLTIWFLSLQRTDFSPIVTLNLAANCVAFTCCLWTPATAGKQQAAASLISDVWSTVSRLFSEEKYSLFRCALVRDFFFTLSGCAGIMQSSVAMMVHGMSMQTPVAITTALSILDIPTPVLGMAFAKRFGTRRFLLFLQLLRDSLSVVLALLSPLSLTCLYSMWISSGILTSLLGSHFVVAAQQIPHNAAETRGVAGAFMSAAGMLTGIVAGPPITALLQVSLAEERSYLVRALPFLMWAVCYLLSQAVHFRYFWPVLVNFFGSDDDASKDRSAAELKKQE